MSFHPSHPSQQNLKYGYRANDYVHCVLILMAALGLICLLKGIGYIIAVRNYITRCHLSTCTCVHIAMSMALFVEQNLDAVSLLYEYNICILSPLVDKVKSRRNQIVRELSIHISGGNISCLRFVLIILVWN